METRDQAPAGLLKTITIRASEAPLQIPGELVRKSLHLMIALVPVLASVNLTMTTLLVALGTLFYAVAEASRRAGMPVLLVSDLTLIASRGRDTGKFVLGPVTLGLGALLSLMLYPEPSASIAIYALAFGDGFASLVGKTVGGPRIPFLRGKTFSGTFACLTAVFLATFRITGKPVESLVIAGVATALEAVPTGDFDNLIMPLGTGLLATELLFR